VAELASLLRGSDENINALAVVNLLTIVSMFVRNLLLLSIFSQGSGLLAFGPILVMAGVSAAFVWWQHGDSSPTPAIGAIGGAVLLLEFVLFRLSV
jgi:hypothetical protein